jgi:putative SOS response-associated peptidase YedK
MLGSVCGRYTNTAGPEEIGGRLEVKIPDDRGTHRFNIAPTEEVLAVVARHGEREARLLRWGLVPQWMRDRAQGPGRQPANKMINARLESATSNATYRRLIASSSHRALQVADGWYEWLKAERPRQPRQPFHFTVDRGIVFAFAALWTTARGDQGERIESVTLLTCDARENHVASAIHDRMPVVLADPELQAAWLDPNVGAEEALALCGALPADRLGVRPVNPAVNSVHSVEGPELLAAPEPRAAGAQAADAV